MTPLLFIAVWFLSAIPVGLVLGRFLGAQNKELCAQRIEKLVHPGSSQNIDYAEHGVYFYQDRNR